MWSTFLPVLVIPAGTCIHCFQFIQFCKVKKEMYCLFYGVWRSVLLVTFLTSISSYSCCFCRGSRLYVGVKNEPTVNGNLTGAANAWSSEG